jgi:hypothetical protein
VTGGDGCIGSAPQARVVAFELLDAGSLNGPPQGRFDAALHFAGLALIGESVSHRERYYCTNVGGTLDLLAAMSDASSSLHYLRGLRAARSGPDCRDATGVAGGRVRGIEARVEVGNACAFAQAHANGYSDQV